MTRIEFAVAVAFFLSKHKGMTQVSFDPETGLISKDGSSLGIVNADSYEQNWKQHIDGLWALYDFQIKTYSLSFVLNVLLARGVEFNTPNPRLLARVRRGEYLGHLYLGPVSQHLNDPDLQDVLYHYYLTEGRDIEIGVCFR